MSETSKQAYLEALRRELASLPAAEADKSVAFIEEMIDDRMEDGATEAEAVAALGSPAEVARSIAAELPPIPGAVAKLKTGSRAANWVLAVVLSPLWVPLAAAAALTAASVYLTIWALALSVWLLAIGLLLGGPLGLGTLAYCWIIGMPVVGLWQLGGGLLCFGLGVFCLFGAMRASAWLVRASHRYAAMVKSLFVRTPKTGAFAKEAACEG
ncbi:DUF1700 domain-containing protein [Rubneribacter sp.]|nr:DUF1700 domain-containing protein [Candidatus Rubneribacter avistercoris]